VSVIAAPWIVKIYASANMSAAQFDLAVAFARLCLPQIFFYGAYTMLQQVLNARGKFAAAFFAPVANNIVAIFVFISFIVVVQPNASNLSSLSSEQVWWLGLGSTIGVAVQAIILFPALLKSGYKFSWRSDWKNAGLGHAAHLAKWTIYLVIINQIAFAIITRLSTNANVAAEAAGQVAIGLTSYQKANLIFILPHSVITISLVTALLPQLSRLAHSNDWSELGRQVSRASRIVLSLMFPIAALLAITGSDIAILLFGNGVASTDAARAVGHILTLFALGLPAYSVIYILNRASYAMEDTKSPFWIAIVINVLMLIVALPLFNIVELDQKIAMFGVAYSVSYIVSCLLAWKYLNSKTNSLEGRATFFIAAKALVASLIAGAVAFALKSVMPASSGVASTLTSLLVTWLIGVAVFVACARIFKITEVQQGISLVSGRLRRR
jgi:putative peptidoglycan lipid II flippase